MLEGTKFDSTDSGTLRPNAQPISVVGEAFIPMNLPQFYPEITLPDTASQDDPISLFDLYYPIEIIDQIVECTNKYDRKPQDPTLPYVRANRWDQPTWAGEIYTYFAIRIYMTLTICNEISDYWSTSKETANHPIAKAMTRARFEELHIRFRVTNEDATPYERVRNTPLFTLISRTSTNGFAFIGRFSIKSHSSYEPTNLPPGPRPCS